MMQVNTIFGTQECAGAQRRKDGVYLFDEDGKVIICVENAEDILSVTGGEIVVAEAPEPSKTDKLEAQVTYTAMMTDTLLEV